jgi:hypothetical protein
MILRNAEMGFVPHTEEEPNIDCDRLKFSNKRNNMNDIFWINAGHHWFGSPNHGVFRDLPRFA